MWPMFLRVSDYAWLDFICPLGILSLVPFLFILAFLGDQDACLRWRGVKSEMSRLPWTFFRDTYYQWMGKDVL